MNAQTPSPRQNRVDPWSHVIATRERGLLMGNRGCLHNAAGHIVRDYQVARWIICVLQFRGRKRVVMQPGHYTELFFLDEATALAAGHRPCAECQRARYKLFLAFWAKTQRVDPSVGDPGAQLRARDIDAALHTARWADGHKVTYPARLGDLPNGAMVAASVADGDRKRDGAAATPYLVWQGQLWRWHFAGYTAGPGWHAETIMHVLTPRPTVQILAAGYPVQVHPSLGAILVPH